MGAVGTVVADWAGDAGRVVEFGTRFTKPVVVPVGGAELHVVRARSTRSTPRPAGSAWSSPRRAAGRRSSAGARPWYGSTDARAPRRPARATSRRCGSEGRRAGSSSSRRPTSSSTRSARSTTPTSRCSSSPAGPTSSCRRGVRRDGRPRRAPAASPASPSTTAAEPWSASPPARSGTAFVARAIEERWTGVEALSGIPGSTGATPVQNVGAYGQEIVLDARDGAGVGPRRPAGADVRQRRLRVRLPDLALQGDRPLRRPRRAFQLVVGDLSAPIGYADLARELGVPLGSRVPLARAREAVLAQRRRRGMVLDPADHDTWSCGSFFTNPILDADGFAALRARVVDRLGPQSPTPPEYPEPDGGSRRAPPGSSTRPVSGRASGCPGPAAVSTKHTPRRDQPRRGERRRHRRAGPADPRRGRRRRSASSSSTSRCSSARPSSGEPRPRSPDRRVARPGTPSAQRSRSGAAASQASMSARARPADLVGRPARLEEQRASRASVGVVEPVDARGRWRTGRPAGCRR